MYLRRPGMQWLLSWHLTNTRQPVVIQIFSVLWTHFEMQFGLVWFVNQIFFAILLLSKYFCYWMQFENYLVWFVNQIFSVNLLLSKYFLFYGRTLKHSLKMFSLVCYPYIFFHCFVIQIYLFYGRSLKTFWFGLYPNNFY